MPLQVRTPSLLWSRRDTAWSRHVPAIAATTVLLVAAGASVGLWEVVRAAPRAVLGVEVLSAGIGASLLLALATWLTLRAQRRALATIARSAEAHRRNEARLQGIIRSAMEAIITIDAQQRIVIFNPAAEALFRCPAQEAIGTSLSRFIPERFRGIHAQHVERFGITGVSERQMGHQRALSGLRADGEEFPIEASISQLTESGGKLYTVMLRDITERVRDEQALKASRDELRQLSARIEAAREDEKKRIARELHDDLGQRLTALKMDLSAFEARLPDGSPADLLRDAQAMRQFVDATAASTRRLATDLRPMMLDDLGLAAAIQWLVEDFSKRYGIATELRLDENLPSEWSSEGATAIFRIVQEALTNVARHADATHVDIDLNSTGDACVVRVADNGRGLPENGTRKPQSFGLVGIRERVGLLDGEMAMDGSSGAGVTIRVTLPLAAVSARLVGPLSAPGHPGLAS